MNYPTPATCRHDLSTLIEPPTAEGWMRESCGSCEQVLRWSIWPHHHRARAAQLDDVSFCGGCGEEVPESDLAVNGHETFHLQCLAVVEQA